MNYRKDYLLGAVAGFLTGICLIPTLINIGYKDTTVLAIAPFACAAVISWGVWLGSFLMRWIGVMFQLAKFAAVGFLNTAINFAVLNLLSLYTGVAAGFSVGEYNVPATAIAATNSYFWNKFWVFKGTDQAVKDVPKFIIVTVLGMVARSAVLILVTSYVPHAGIGSGAWLNIANVFATFVGIFVDFLGYKFLVFKK